MAKFESPYYSVDDAFALYHGDCMDLLPQIPDNSVSTIFADPPYFLSNGGISCQNGQVVCVDKGDWDKGGTPEYIYEFNRQWNSKITVLFGLAAPIITFTSSCAAFKNWDTRC